MHPN